MQHEEAQRAVALSPLDAFFGVLFRPTETFGQWKDEVPLAAALGWLAFLAGNLAFVVAPAGIAGLLFTWLVVVSCLMFFWLLLAALVFVVGSFFGGRGGIFGVLGAVAYAFLPLIFLAPISAWWLTEGNSGAVGAAILSVLLWWGHALTAAVRGSMQLSGGQAALTLMGAELAVVGIPALGSVLSVLALLLFVM